MTRIAQLSRVLLGSAALLAACGAEPEVTAEPESAPAASQPTALPPEAFAEDTKDNSAQKELYKNGQASVAPVSDASATEWMFRFNSATEAVPVYSSSSLSIFDGYSGNYVVYQSRDYGINLGWSSTAPRNITFLRAAGAGALRFGDVIALRVNNGGYVKYGSRTWGINLVWSSTPVYEWQIEGGPVGQNVLTNQRVRLVNRTERSGMVYCRRPVGVNLAWQDNCTEALGYRILIDYLCSINPIC